MAVQMRQTKKVHYTKYTNVQRTVKARSRPSRGGKETRDLAHARTTQFVIKHMVHRQLVPSAIRGGQ